MPGGRPPEYTREKAEAICARILCGEGVVQICRDADMPGERTVYSWLLNNTEFQQMYTRAREVQAERFAEEVVSIADSLDEYATSEQVQAARLKTDNRKWAAGKLSPRKYGDRLTTENHTTIDASDPILALIARVAETGKKVHDPEK